MDMTEFISKYNVTFGTIPADLEDKFALATWGSFIASIPASDLDRIFAKVEQGLGKSHFKPRIRDFRMAMDELKAAVYVPQDGPGCGLCDETGYVSVLGWVDPAKPRQDNTRFVLGYINNRSRLYISAVPCKCTKGRGIAAKAGLQPDQLGRYHAWFDGFLTECQLAGEPYWSRMRRMETLSVQQFGPWPTPGNVRKAPNPSQMPQERRLAPMATLMDKAIKRAPEAIAGAAAPIRADIEAPNW